MIVVKSVPVTTQCLAVSSVLNDNNIIIIVVNIHYNLTIFVLERALYGYALQRFEKFRYKISNKKSILIALRYNRVYHEVPTSSVSRSVVSISYNVLLRPGQDP